MTDYTKTTNFASKDSLPSGNANKIVKGTEIDTEFNNIATASATKANIASPTFTGVVSFPDGSASAPSITNTGDTNTGLFFSAADTLAFTAAGVSQFTMADGVIAPVTDNDVDLGTSSLEFKDGYFDGTLYTDAINLNGTAITSTAAEINILDGVTATAAELNILDGVTATTAELNILDGVTSTTAELNILDGVTATAAELNIMDGVTATTAELNIMDGVTSTTAELNILDGVTSTAAELNILDGKAFLDEDNMASNSATGIASQQSIKAYVDSQVTAQDLDVTDGTTSIDIDLDSESLGILGGTGIDSTASGTGVTLAIDSTVATLTGSQTLTNKTIDVDNNTVSNIEVDNLKSGVLDTDLTSVAATDTTLASAKAIKTYVDAQVTAQDLDFQADSGGALSIDLDSETLTFTGGTGIDTSGSGNAVTFAIDSTVATLTGSQTLTNKTLTSPDINTPDIDGGTIDGTTIGGSTAAAGTFTSVAVDNITIDGTEIDLSSGSLTLDVADTIKLDADDAGEVRYLDGGTHYATIKKDGNNALFQSIVADGDFIIQGIDGSSFVSAASFDMSAGGSPTFNGNITMNAVAGTGPLFEMINNDNEDNDTGRESSVRFSGHRSGGEDVVNAQIGGHHDGSADDDKGMLFFYTNNGSGLNLAMKIRFNGQVEIPGSLLVSGTKNFSISHPLPEKADTHYLVHSAIESPQAELIYRGSVDLVAGSATVNIDTAAGMSEGTFDVLCADVQCFTSNESGWTAVKGSVSGNTLTITAQDNTCTDTISWMVVGERQDENMLNASSTDDSGRIIVEPLKPVEPETL